MKRRTGQLGAFLALLILIGAGWIALRAPRTPPSVPADAESGKFSAERAMAWVELIAAEAHPPGTHAHAKVRKLIAARLAELGLEPEIHAAVAHRGRPQGALVAARVQNVVARRRGTGSGDAVLVIAHYDARARAPGAADDAAGVAAILESLRALGETPLINDLVVLIPDAEELGLLGARAFAEQHPWMEDVRVALNLEGRGNGGPVIMFETAPENGRLVRLFAEASPWPVADSFSYEIYKRMPNDTDYSVFRRRGIPGLNFAFLEGIEAYHTELDTPERLDRGSLQHHGLSTLALLRRLGDEPLDHLEAPDAIYFNPWGGRRLVLYPAIWSRALGLAGFGGVVLLLVFGTRRGRLEGKETALGFFGGLGSLVLAPAVAAGGWWLLRTGWPLLTAGPQGLPYNSLALAGGFLLLVTAVVAGIGRWVWDRTGTPATLGGILLLWSILGVATGFVLPGGSYLFQLPLLIALLPASVLIAGRPGLRSGLLLATLVALPAIVLFTPFVQILHSAMTFHLLVPTAVFATLALLLAVPLLARFPYSVGTGGVAAAGVVVLLLLATTAPHDEDHPRADSLLYLLDADTWTASWISYDEAPDSWTRKALGNSPERIDLPVHFGGPRPALAKKAPLLPLASPRVELVATRPLGQGRSLRLRAVSDRRAPVLLLSFEGESSMRVTRLAGEPVQRDWSAPSETPVFFFAAPSTGIEVEIELTGSEPLTVHLTDQSWPLPESGPGPRPPGYIPSTSWRTDATFAHRSFLF